MLKIIRYIFSAQNHSFELPPRVNNTRTNILFLILKADRQKLSGWTIFSLIPPLIIEGESTIMRNLTKRQEDALHAISNFLIQYGVHQCLYEPQIRRFFHNIFHSLAKTISQHSDLKIVGQSFPPGLQSCFG